MEEILSSQGKRTCSAPYSAARGHKHLLPMYKERFRWERGAKDANKLARNKTTRISPELMAHNPAKLNPSQ